MKTELKTQAFKDFLRKIYVNGSIQDCVLRISKKDFFVDAVDNTNSLLVIGHSKNIIEDRISNGEDLFFGLSNINIIYKFISTLKSEKTLLELKDNRFILSSVNNQRKFVFLLSDPDTISTSMEQGKSQNLSEKLLHGQSIKVNIDKNLIDDFQSYIALSDSKKVALETRRKDFLIEIGEDNTHKFSLKIRSGDVEILDPKNSGVEISLNGDFLSKVFSVVDSDKNDIQLYAKNSGAIVIKENRTIWAITPLFDEDEEEEKK